MTIDLEKPLESVRYEKRDHIAFITLNRPEKGNSLTRKMESVFRAIWADVRDDSSVRVAIITAAGDKHFCTGFDVSSAQDGESPAADLPLAESVFWTSRQNKVWKPTICAVNGVAASGGLHFVVDSDIIVASDRATFMDTHVNVGMVGALENICLAKRLPLGTALRMTLQGRNFRLSAARAHALGLVDELTTPENLLSTAEAIARDIAKNSPQAMALSQRAIWESLERPHSDALEHGWALVRSHWSHPDFIEGGRAFMEKREPAWNPDPKARR